MSVPLDDDGFLRRECPACKRQFKWLDSQDAGDEAAEVDAAGYYCPYCGLQAAATRWWTKEQLDHAEAIVTEEVIAPELQKLKKKVESASGGVLQVSADISTADSPASDMTEPNDMVRVDFACHPSEPVKIEESWPGGVHCLICGTVAQGS